MILRTTTLLAHALLHTACASSPGGAAAPAVDRPAASAAAPASAPLDIRVVDADGAPLRGATVFVLGDAGLSSTAARLASRSTGDYAATLRALAECVATTGPDGRARTGRPSGTSVLVAAERGASFGTAEVGAAAAARPIEVAARARVEHRVRVVAPNGEPMAGVAVSAAVASDTGSIELLPATARTGVDGEALLRVPAGALGGRSGVAVARIASAERVRAPLDPDGATVLELPPTVELRGAVPAEGVDVWWQVFPALDGSRSDATLVHRAKDGVARLGRVERGLDLRAVAALVDAATGAPLGRLEWAVPRGVGGGDRTIELPLDEYLELGGRVVATDGAPLAETEIVLRVLGRPRWTWPTRTGADGRFRWYAPRRIAMGGRLRADVGTRGPTSVVELPEALGAALEAGDLVLGSED
ncbi:MAG: hypothetical protein AAFU73_04335 [Planctomycetota bacterium]